MTKSVFGLITLFLFGLIISNSCSDENYGPISLGEIIYENNSYPLHEGYIKNIERQTDGTNVLNGVIIHSSGVSFYPLEDDQVLFTGGKGNALILNFVSSNALLLENGIYIFDSLCTHEEGTFLGFVYIDFHSREKTGLEEYIKQGFVTVNGANEIYDLSFECTLENGKQIEGSFNGKLPLITDL